MCRRGEGGGDGKTEKNGNWNDKNRTRRIMSQMHRIRDGKADDNDDHGK
jgi:hypothetical protein